MDKIAKLVSFQITTRIIADDDWTDEDKVSAAADNIIHNGIDNYLCMDNVIDIADDTECPYDPKKDFDYNEAERLLEQHLNACYPLTSEMKEADEDPDWDCIGGMQLCYDEGNEEIRTGNWQFWHELPFEIRQYVLQKFME